MVKNISVMMILKIKRDRERYSNSAVECEQDTQWKNSPDLSKYGQSVTTRR